LTKKVEENASGAKLKAFSLKSSYFYLHRLIDPIILKITQYKRVPSIMPKEPTTKTIDEDG
jgi:hypothetical protein